jgi:hypothetical protein
MFLAFRWIRAQRFHREVDSGQSIHVPNRAKCDGPGLPIIPKHRTVRILPNAVRQPTILSKVCLANLTAVAKRIA